jgi:hypothetical protein
MTTINSVQQIVATIRAEMAERVALGDAPSSRRRTREKHPVVAKSGDLISRRVQALDPADPQRGRKAFRIFLESVLLNELGEELINDNAFYLMVDQVQKTMEQDPRIGAAIAQAVASLLEQPPASR